MKKTFGWVMLCLLATQFAYAQKPEYGLASFYHDKFQGSTTASGEVYDKDQLTAAHPSLPFGTMVKVTRLDNKKSVVVRINDRGPFLKGYIIDLSRKAADMLDLPSAGKAQVEVLTTGQSSVSSTPAAETPPAKPAPSTPPPASSSTTNEEPAKPKETPKPAPPKVNINTPKGAAGFYKVDATAENAEGFGVQIGLYSNFELLLKQVSILKGKGFKDVFVWVDETTNGNQYKIILGNHADIDKATSYKDNLKKKFNLSGFVVDFSKL